MNLKAQTIKDLPMFFNTDEMAETITYTPVGGSGKSIKVLVERDDRLEDYVRGAETATCVIEVKTSDVTDPKHGDIYTITNADGESEVWEFLREFQSDMNIRKLALERRLS